MSDWFDDLLNDVDVRSKQRDADNDIAKNVKIKIKELDDNALIVVTYDFKNGTKTLTLYPEQRLEDFLTQITTKRDIDVLKYVVKTVKTYADMNNVLKELMTFDLDEYYENNVKKKRVMLTNVNMNVNNVIQHDENNDVEQQNVNNDVHNNDDTQNNVGEQQNNNNDEQQYNSDVEQQNNVDEQLLQQLRSLINDLNNVNLNDVHNNDELYNATNYVIQRFVMFLINVDNYHDGVINNVINYLRRDMSR